MKKAIVMDPKDNVATLLTDVDKNDVVQVSTGGKLTEFRVQEKIQFGHKFAVKRIDKGENVNATLEELLAQGVPRPAAARRVASTSRWSRAEVYALGLRDE